MEELQTWNFHQPRERRAAKNKAQHMFDRVARFHAEGDPFCHERLELLRVLKLSMGIHRSKAGEVLTSALAGDHLAEEEAVLYLQRAILDCGEGYC